MDYRQRVDEIAQTLAPQPRYQSIFATVTDRVDPAGVAALQRKYADSLRDFHPAGVFKYADIPYWIAHKIALAVQLGLDERPPLSLLDIGMGAGHFAAVCQALGHKVIGTDISVPVYDDICGVLGVDRRIEPTRLRQPLSPLGAQFDMVTVIWQVFHVIRQHKDGSRDHWSPRDWGFFLQDLIDHHMTPVGDIFIKLNRNVIDGELAYDAVLLDWCERMGERSTAPRAR